MGRGFDSARQRHQHIESTMTTGFTQNISPKAANTAQSSLITPQFAEKTTKERLKKITSSRARHHCQPSFQADCCFTLAMMWTTAVTCVWTSGLLGISEGKNKLKKLETSLQSPVPHCLFSHSSRQGDPHAHRNKPWPALIPTCMDHTRSKNQSN